MTKVCLRWNEGDTHITHADIYSWTVQMFGLPGERFMFHPTSQAMEFDFNHRDDALLFALRFSERVINETH
jgi:hypothetical protein